MRIVFMGASELGWQCCRTLLEMGQQVVGLFSIPPQFSVSWSTMPVHNVRFRSFEGLAEEYRIPLTYMKGKATASACRRELERLKPDLIAVIGWYYMVPRSWRDIASLGAVGIHASMLPRYRGGAPLVWAMIRGESSTGTTLFHLGDGADDGDIIGQVPFAIEPEDEIGDLIAKATSASVELVRLYIPKLVRGEALRVAQDHRIATTYPQRNPEDGLIDWASKSAVQVHNWVRAQTSPYPGAFTFHEGRAVHIWKTSLTHLRVGQGVLPGSLLIDDQYPFDLGVVCGDGSILGTCEVSVAAGAVIPARDFREQLQTSSKRRFDAMR